jgi:DNA polymerase alpha subunit A
LQVALRRRAAGKRDGVSAGETVPYIICVRRSLEEEQQQQQQQQEEKEKEKENGQAEGDAAAEAAGAPQQQPQQQGEAAPHSPAPAPAAAGPPSGTPQQQQQVVAAGGATPGAPMPAGTSNKAPSKPAAAGGIAERAFHPEELREDPTLAVDRDYYLSQQVHPVVARLCAPIEVRLRTG